jgi:hypothetical protein
MKRIVTMLTVALVMAAMMVAMGMPAFAQHPTNYPPGLVGTPFHGQDTQECRSTAQEEIGLNQREASFACTPSDPASSPF